jgi:hypothetical protein
MIKHTIHTKIQAEAEKKTLADEWGGFWFVTGEIVGKILLGIVGAAADLLVLLSIFYLSTRNWGLSLMTAGILSIGIQLTMGAALMRAVKGFTRKDYERKGFKPMIFLAFIIFLVMLSLTGYLSLNTGSVVEAFTEETLKLEDKEAILSGQDGAISALTAQYNSDLQALRKEAQTLDNDKIMWQGKWTVRERSSRQAAKIRGEKIPALQAAYQSNLDRLQTEKSTLRQEINEENQRRTENHEAKVEKTSSIAIGFNLIFNLVRCFILAGFMVFLVNAGNEIAAQPQEGYKSASPAQMLAIQAQEEAVLQNRTEIEQERKRIAPFQVQARTAKPSGKAYLQKEYSASELRKIKEAARQNFKTAIDQKKSAVTRASNKMMMRQRAEILRANGYSVTINEKGKIFDVKKVI